MTVILELAAGSVVNVLQVPPESVSKAILYIRICSGGILIIIAYNVISSVLRGVGNANLLFPKAMPFLWNRTEKDPEYRHSHCSPGDSGTDFISGHYFHCQQYGTDALCRIRSRTETDFIYHAGSFFCYAERIRICGTKYRCRSKGCAKKDLLLLWSPDAPLES